MPFYSYKVTQTGVRVLMDRGGGNKDPPSSDDRSPNTYLTLCGLVPLTSGFRGFPLRIIGDFRLDHCSISPMSYSTFAHFHLIAVGFPAQLTSDLVLGLSSHPCKVRMDGTPYLIPALRPNATTASHSVPGAFPHLQAAQR